MQQLSFQQSAETCLQMGVAKAQVLEGFQVFAPYKQTAQHQTQHGNAQSLLVLLTATVSCIICIAHKQKLAAQVDLCVNGNRATWQVLHGIAFQRPVSQWQLQAASWDVLQPVVVQLQHCR